MNPAVVTLPVLSHRATLVALYQYYRVLTLIQKHLGLSDQSFFFKSNFISKSLQIEMKYSIKWKKTTFQKGELFGLKQ